MHAIQKKFFGKYEPCEKPSCKELKSTPFAVPDKNSFSSNSFFVFRISLFIMNYKTANEVDEFSEDISIDDETKILKEEIKNNIINFYSPTAKESFSDELGSIYMKIIKAYNDGNPSEVLSALIEANQLNSHNIIKFYEDSELIKNIKQSNVIQIIFDLVFTNDNESVNLEEEDLDTDLIDENDFNDPQLKEINSKVTYNGLAFLLFHSAFSSDLSNFISSFNFLEKFFNAIDWYSPECIKIGLLIGSNIILDSTPKMLLEFNNKQNITQMLVDIACNDSYSIGLQSKLTEETSIMACQMLYFFNLRGNFFNDEYIIGYSEAISRLIDYVPDGGRVFLVKSIYALFSKKSISHFDFLFYSRDDDENSLIDKLLDNLVCDFVPLRRNIVHLLRIFIVSEQFDQKWKETMLTSIEWNTFNSIISQIPEDTSDLLTLVCSFSGLGQSFEMKLFEFNVYSSILELFDEFSWKDREVVLKIFTLVVNHANAEFSIMLYEIGCIHPFYSMLGTSNETNEIIVHSLCKFLFQIQSKYHDQMIELAQEEQLDSVLFEMDRTDDVTTLIHLLEIPTDD